MQKCKILFITDCLSDGGAERAISVFSSGIAELPVIVNADVCGGGV